MRPKKIQSKQTEVMFTFCPHPVTIDKSKEWGDGNIQEFPNGVFLKHDDDGIVTHGVQPNESNDAPIGWSHIGSVLYEKKPIFLGAKVSAGRTVRINTLDGEMNYNVKKDSYLCYNGDEEPDMNDCYIQSVEDIENNYFID